MNVEPPPPILTEFELERSEIPGDVVHLRISLGLLALSAFLQGALILNTFFQDLTPWFAGICHPLILIFMLHLGVAGAAYGVGGYLQERRWRCLAAMVAHIVVNFWPPPFILLFLMVGK